MEIPIRRYVSAVAGLALMGWAAVVAAEAQTAQITVPAPNGQQIEISTKALRDGRPERAVNLPEGKAFMIRLPVEVRDVLVADPKVADVVIMSSRQIYLIGRAAGSTNAFFLDDLGNELLRPEILVQLDIVSANQALKVLLPDTDIKITAVKSHLFLTGNVRSAGISEIAQIVASRFVADKANVINMLVVIEDQLGEPKSKSAPSPAIAPVVVGEPKNETRSVTIYRAAAPSTIVIKK